MEFRTRIPIKEEQPQINYESRAFLTGSCFVENIGKKFEFYQLRNLQNPLGILFHPFAIENLCSRMNSDFQYSEADIFFRNERWHCFEAHSAMSHPDKAEFLQKLNQGLKSSRAFLKETSHVILTPGTSWYYRHLEQEKNVANCHKVPQKEFEKKLASVEEVKQSLQNSVRHLQQLAPKASIIFTVSPVRHLKDGLVENQRSKAHLIAAVQDLVSEFRDLRYFPSYELLMDELRDYRFYAEDMLHPGNTAIDYIWEKFSEAWIADDSRQVMKRVQKIRRGLAHRPFNENSEAHKSFLQQLQREISRLQEEFPHILF